MKIVPTPLDGCFVIEPEPFRDERGFFMRTFCATTFRERGLNPEIDQCSFSFNQRRHTLRGMHFQAAPRMEDKLVRVVQGAIYDVAVDIRPGSKTFGQWFGQELTADNHLALYIPQGFAHGFLTLSDEAMVAYQIAQPYQADLARGLNWNDAQVGIVWPHPPEVISARDAVLPGLGDLALTP
ncbi:dTDP-4-dehydrorhamnose 3,5-epimerase [Rhodopseudomonas palustris]|uniref:dTDP-4-dehydrorhamnose 3,5-epimerase n=1 Tax=Rhodopseudomonas palustris TaxID=1076 RepID=UPI00115F6288|nr:dTDP-4-dehydrorhamnose 3,5-epimerase [Rhodopseudomonas palustris]QDL98674.1 dTDP-4-dehydrorhamnose 3,5-epimerase [Rhodopseudomonas palustris]